MSTKYNDPKEVPTEELCERLYQLSDAARKGAKAAHEFTMRVPAEVDHDADIVIGEAARRIKQLQTENDHLLHCDEDGHLS